MSAGLGSSLSRADSIETSGTPFITANARSSRRPIHSSDTFYGDGGGWDVFVLKSSYANERDSDSDSDRSISKRAM